MATVKLRNINPLGQVDLPIAARQGEPFGEHGDGCLEPGEIFEVDADIAGRPPKLAKDGTYQLDDDGQPVDVGEGLLAQWTNYELAEPAKKRAPAKKTAAKKTAPASPSTEPASDADHTPEV